MQSWAANASIGEKDRTVMVSASGMFFGYIVMYILA